ncbi:YIP1 family protein [Paenibacillus alkaliterrae]
MIFVGLSPKPAHASPYEGYTYSNWGEAVQSPIAYLPSRTITGQEIGIGPWTAPSDLFAAPDGNLYVLDSGNGRIVVLNSEWKAVRQMQGFQRNGQQESFNNPEGIFVTGAGHIYVADTENRRVVELDGSGAFVREIGAPKSEVISDNFEYFPRKVIVDKAGRIYVVARGVYEGIIEFDSEGGFTGFMGTNRVQFDPVDLFWKTVSTKEQREKLIRFVPIEFNNMDVDADGFIYTTTADKQTLAPVKRLNPSGIDVLRVNGSMGPVGDLSRERSAFIDIDESGNGVYRTLDSTRGRIFTYNEDGNLLYVIGQLGNQIGTFKNPVAIESIGNRIYVLDRDLGRITEFAATKFGSLVGEANGLYSAGKHDAAAKLWEEVLRLDANYEMAYIGIGKSMLRKGEYKQAMTFLKLGNEREYYSKALTKYRREYMREHFGTYMTMVIALILVVMTVRRRMRLRKGASNRMRFLKEARYSLHVAFHPFDGFWDLKYENKGKLRIALIILFAVTVTMILKRQYAGYVVNYNHPLELNSIDELKYIVLPFLLWCVANWSLTTLMDGEGKFKEIVIATGYAMLPLILIYLPNMVLSNVISLREASFYYLLESAAGLWFVWLLFIGTMTVHQYTVTKTILTMLLTVVVMGVIIFLGLLFFSLIQQIVSFVYTIYQELSLRA